MRGNGAGKTAVENTEILVLPKIAQALLTREAGSRPVELDRSIHPAAVKETDGFAAVFELLDPDFRAALLRHAPRRFPERILVHRDNFVVR